MSAHSVAELTASTFVLNGERRPYHTQTVAQLLQTLALADKRVAVEVNAAIVPRSQHALHALAPDDRVEIIFAIGGG
jgi:sulfur carrier protein